MVSNMSDPIDGTWLPFKAELNGECAPDLALAKLKLVLCDGAYAVHFGGEESDSGTYTSGVSEAFLTITLVSRRGANAGRTIPSIYQLKGHLLRICYGLDGTAPSSFASAPGSKCYLVSYRRKTEATSGAEK
jgi:uncharacterized protein (TIGR03067 family)